MNQEDRYKITSNDYTDLIIEFDHNVPLLERFKEFSTHIMNNRFVAVYVPTEQITGRSVNLYGYSAIPKCYGLVSERSLTVSGVEKLRSSPGLNLRGKGVLLGFIDTGIDYTNPVFLNEDGSSRIISIWDQTIDSEDRYPGGATYGDDITYGEPAYFGTEYTMDQINQALGSDSPLTVVPSTDEIGHGTMLAGIAAGSEITGSKFNGVAPDSELVVVKLKLAKENLRSFFSIPPQVPCYQENDIIWGAQYLTRVARRLNRPIAICIGLGSSQGNHDGRGPLPTLLSVAGDFPGVCITVAGGNEGNVRRHFYSTIEPSEGYKTVELNIGENEPGFSMEIWGKTPGSYSIDILSPSGELIPRTEYGLFFNREISFIFEKTNILIDYQALEAKTGEQLILLRFQNPSPGMWRFNVYVRGDLPGSFHIWLPSDEFLSPDTYFLEPNAYTTITSPGDSAVPITVAAYNDENDIFYQKAGRGFNNSDTVKPDLAAPGVNIVSPNLNHGFDSVTGTSAAAAHTAGITALILEWGILRGNFQNINTVEIKKLLILGADRNTVLPYPNRVWGYGILDLYNSFNILRTDF